MENSVGQRHRLPDRAATRRLTRRASPVHPPSQALPRNLATRKSWYRPADHPRPHHPEPSQPCTNQPHDSTKSPIHGFRLSRRAAFPSPRRRASGRVCTMCCQNYGVHCQRPFDPLSVVKPPTCGFGPSRCMTLPNNTFRAPLSRELRCVTRDYVNSISLEPWCAARRFGRTSSSSSTGLG